MINRSGEIISPAEVEERCRAAGVSDVVAISVPHATLQETVGVVIVPTRGIRSRARAAVPARIGQAPAGEVAAVSGAGG